MGVMGRPSSSRTSEVSISAYATFDDRIGPRMRERMF